MIVKFEGRSVKVPDDATDAEIADILSQTASAPAAPSTPEPRGFLGGLKDVALSAGSGVVKGAAEIPMLPVTIDRLGRAGAGMVLEAGEAGVRKLIGMPPVSAAESAERAATTAASPGGRAAAMQDTVRTIMGNTLHKPATTAGEYAQTVGEFAPSAFLGPVGAGQKLLNAGRVVGDWLIPAIMSETAGQVTKGTAAEPWARAAGGIGANVGAATVRARSDAPARTVRDATRNLTQAELDAAQRLHETAARLGVPLSGPEAIQAATNGATKLGDVQRVVEGSTSGGAVTSRFYADRPERVRTAAEAAFDTIAPPSAAPSTLGPRAAEAATGAIDDVRHGINAATRPAYQAAERHTLAQADFDPIAADPAFRASLQRLREDPVLGPHYRNQPDNSVAVIDAVTKDMRDRSVALGNRQNPGFQSQAAGMYGSGAAEARDIARDPARGGVRAYDDALTMQEQARRQNLEPLEQGPLGRVAAATDTRSAYGELLPQRPHVGGDRELVDTIMRLEARDPGAAGALVRQSMADTFDESTRRLVGGENQYGGARFAKDVAGTTQQQTNLDAVLGTVNRSSLPQPGPSAMNRPAEVSDLLDVFRATGQRKPQGSATEFNRQMAADLSEAPLTSAAAGALRSGGTSIPLAVRDQVQRAWLGRNTNTLADLFTAPDSVARIRGVLEQGAQSPGMDALRRQMLQLGGEVRAR
jgi:hypothetical protein